MRPGFRERDQVLNDIRLSLQLVQGVDLLALERTEVSQVLQM